MQKWIERRPGSERPFMPETRWQAPKGHVPYFAQLPALQGRQYDTKVVVVKEYRYRRACYMPGLVGRIVSERHEGWSSVADHQALVDFGPRGVVKVLCEHLRLA